MADRFVALPVGQGDAFFLQRDAFTALIDGGRSRHSLPTLFEQTLKRNSVDIVVCTHNDADHADGVLGFIESGLHCREVWLPALWQDRLDELLTKPGEFFEELVGDVCKLKLAADELLGPHALEHLGDLYSDELSRNNNEPANKNEGVDGPTPETMPLPIETDTDIDPDLLWPAGWLDGKYRHWDILHDLDVLFHGDHRRCPLFGQAVSAARRIRDIAIACAHRGVPIRWFRHSSGQARGGKSGLLKPLNSIEIGRTALRPSIGALKLLALTAANRQSLTFCSPAENGYPGVVFTADSDLKSAAAIPWHENMIATAPHHGSEANKDAYARFRSDINEEFDIIWIRSDGNFKSRPGPSFLHQPRRFCTLCRPASQMKQILRFTVKNGRWSPIKSRRCSCR